MAVTVNAEFRQHRNDMYWSYYDSEDGIISFNGYDDSYWWNNVAPTRYTKVGKNSGKKYTIDYSMGKITITDKNEIY